jgi:hypothetical protein
MNEYRNNIEKITKLGAEYLRQYRAEFSAASEVTETLEIAHEKARQYLENSLPARPGAF